MNEFLRFAVLGLGAGACYGLAAQGIVLVYRGSGVVNFANGAIGMVGAFYFYDARESGTATWLALALALLLGAAVGVAVHFVIMRPLRHAPALSRLIATLGLFTAFYAFALNRYGTNIRIVTKLIEPTPVEVLPDISIGRDRIVLLVVGVALTIVLTVVYRHSRFGYATTAVAESRRATAAQGISPDVIAAVNWAVGTMLGVLAAVLIVNLSGLQVITLTLLIVPALAAALVGSFKSFWLTLAGGLLIGILQSEIAYAQVRWPTFDFSGYAASVPFVVIILVLVIRGRALPLRGEGVERPPEVGTGRVRWWLVLPSALAAVLLVVFVLTNDMLAAVTSTSAIAVIALSLVVVTGYAGQLSLAQYALAGMGAWIAAKLVADAGFSFGVAAIAGVLGAVPVGVLVGLPALRTRGVNLAVATLGLALVIESQILDHPVRSGGFLGIDIGTPTLFGVSLDAVRYPERYAAFAFVVFCVLALLVANLRRSRAGRRLVAVRTNERAAAALGISVFGAKLYAFGLSAAIAAVGGVLIAFQRPTVVFYPTFSVFQSIFVVVDAVIGGIGYVMGALLGAALAPGNIVATLSGDLLNDDQTVQIALGVLLIVVLVVLPNGLASLRAPRRLLARRRPPRARVPPVIAGDEVARVASMTLDVHDVSVQFGGVQAVTDVSMVLRPGEVVGLIGPNGAGKTTLIDAVTGFVKARGHVVLDGRDVSKWSARRRARAGLGRSFQSLELFESMTVYENLRAASDRRDPLAYLVGLVWPGHDQLSPAAVAAVREFGLVDDLGRRPDELPYGRRRLVAIARAVAAGPSVLLLDEPAAGLGDQETAELGRLVRHLADEWGLAVLMVEHDVGLVLRICDRVTVLDEGVHLATGPPEQIRHDPKVVAAYLGEPAGTRVPRVRPEPDAAAAPATAPAEPVVEVHGLWAGYGDLAAVRDLELTVAAGEVVALLGPNGAGKTTTLLTLAGELAPLRGDVRVLGAEAGMPLQRLARRGLGFVPEERAVIASLSTAANLALSRGDRRVALELFPELEPLLRRRAGLLSGGEQQMLTLARALASNPRLLLVDELSLGLAPLVVRRLLLAVRAAADRGVGVLLVEQHAADALDVADRIVVLRHGAVVLTGTADELRDQVGDLESAYLTGA
ncbi:MAG TPA: ATP-binding cassette domain-containing protein [Acidimicrobiia bacterium]|nr:ATP-binding cassette domain-containing protein [Acidimicrobiia bacterium]